MRERLTEAIPSGSDGVGGGDRSDRGERDRNETDPSVPADVEANLRELGYR
ncbi:hypothetical protein [Halorussus sp. MSC15.2]|uniref:hypothetical protein n=1 Tax=Halorussus sp. MSC15.2 TaxID=2283638 RepID=UPI0013D4BC33|nr:hypothetical protein [Halorussus sp. MSC15.2]NEU56558.1 hypothetical protein [Halorussus sp. MSC15.2]